MIIIVDLSWQMYRAASTFSHMSVGTGAAERPTGHLYSVAKFATTMQYDRLIFVKDNYPQARHDIFPAYKAGRESNKKLHKYVPIVADLLANLPNVEVVEAEGREADEVIGFLALHYAAKGEEVVIFSGDNDMLQLVGTPRISVGSKVSKGCVVPVTEDEVVEKFTVLPKHLAVYRTLIGDTSDNIKILPYFPRELAKYLALLVGEFSEIRTKFTFLCQRFPTHSMGQHIYALRKKYSTLLAVHDSIVSLRHSKLRIEDVKRVEPQETPMWWCSKLLFGREIRRRLLV